MGADMCVGTETRKLTGTYMVFIDQFVLRYILLLKRIPSKHSIMSTT